MGRSNHTIYVGNLPGDVTKGEIEDLFYKYGRIIDIDLKLPPRPPGYCFVEFEDGRDAEDAIRGRDGYKFDGHRLRVEMARGGRASSVDMYDGGSYYSGSRSSSTYRHSGYRVLVYGLPSSASWQDLKDHMRRAGDVCFAEVYRKRTGTVGVVDYTTYEDMKYAIRKLDDSEFRNPFSRSYIRIQGIGIVTPGVEVAVIAEVQAMIIGEDIVVVVIAEVEATVMAEAEAVVMVIMGAIVGVPLEADLCIHIHNQDRNQNLCQVHTLLEVDLLFHIHDQDRNRSLCLVHTLLGISLTHAQDHCHHHAHVRFPGLDHSHLLQRDHFHKAEAEVQAEAEAKAEAKAQAQAHLLSRGELLVHLRPVLVQRFDIHRGSLSEGPSVPSLSPRSEDN
ncbi:hypothetical protein KI387_011692, partial [Taxus chinensis]